MKIGIDCRLWGETGVGRYIRNLVENLTEIDKSNEYVLFCLGKDIDNIKFEIRNPKYEINRIDIRWHSLEEQVKFPQVLNSQNLDLVHFPYFSVPIFYNKPFVVTIHDLILHHFPTGEASTLPLPVYYTKLAGYKFVIFQTAKRAKKIIAVSNSTKKEITDHLNVRQDKVEVIYEGVSINSKLETRNSKLKNLPVKFFLYVGNVYPHKNVDCLIKAFSEISKQKDIKLIFVGKEDYFYNRLKEKVRKLELDNKILYEHNINDSELAYLYKHAIALITPSMMEGFGLTPLEALANECLVIASDIPAHREILADIPIYFDPSNKSSLVDAINKSLIDASKFEGYKKKGLVQAEKYSWKKMAKETLKVYETAA